MVIPVHFRWGCLSRTPVGGGPFHSAPPSTYTLLFNHSFFHTLDLYYYTEWSSVSLYLYLELALFVTTHSHHHLPYFSQIY